MGVGRLLLALPALVLITLVLFLPAVAGLVEGISRPGLLRWQWLVLQSRGFWSALATTGMTAAVSVALQVGWGSVVAWWIWRGWPGRRLWLGAIGALVILPEITVAAAARAAREAFAFLAELPPVLFMGLIDAWRGFPVFALGMLAALSSIPPVRREAVEMLGATFFDLMALLLGTLRRFWVALFLVRMLQAVELFTVAAAGLPRPHPPLLVEVVMAQAGTYRLSQAVTWAYVAVLVLAAFWVYLVLRPAVDRRGGSPSLLVTLLPAERGGPGV